MLKCLVVLILLVGCGDMGVKGRITVNHDIRIKGMKELRKEIVLLKRELNACNERTSDM